MGALKALEKLRRIKEMEKLKFETVGQFLVALEEGPLYCNKGCRFILDNHANEIHVEDLNTPKTMHCNTIWWMKEFTKEREFTRQKPIPDKALVWCWDDDCIAFRAARFYDAKNNCIFTLHGQRDGSNYSNYEVIEPNERGIYEEPFTWANEAVKKLED